MTPPLLVPDPRPAPLPWPAEEPTAAVAQPALPLLATTPRLCAPEPVPTEVTTLVHAAAEVVTGRRALATLGEHVGHRASLSLSRIGAVPGASVASVRCQRVGQAVEACVRLAASGQSRALALRVEQRGRRWRVVDVEG